MIWILDGYNLIHAVKSLERALEKDLRSARSALIDRCEMILEKRGDIQLMIIVFDGSSEFCGLPSYLSQKLKVLFTESGEDADDRIIELLHHQRKNVNYCVVSNDNYVTNHARSCGADALCVDDFENLYRLVSTTKNNQSNEKPLSQLSKNAITMEYKRILGIYEE